LSFYIFLFFYYMFVGFCAVVFSLFLFAIL